MPSTSTDSGNSDQCVHIGSRTALWTAPCGAVSERFSWGCTPTGIECPDGAPMMCKLVVTSSSTQCGRRCVVTMCWTFGPRKGGGTQSSESGSGHGFWRQKARAVGTLVSLIILSFPGVVLGGRGSAMARAFNKHGQWELRSVCSYRFSHCAMDRPMWCCFRKVQLGVYSNRHRVS